MMKNKFKLASVKSILLASVLCVGVAAGTTIPTLMTGAPSAQAKAVEITGPVQAVDFTKVVQAVKPAVVSVQVKTRIDTDSTQLMGIPGFPEFKDLPEDHPFNRFFRRFGDEQGQGEQKKQKPRYAQSQGSGFFISEDGLVVTNHHVVENGSDFKLVMDDGTELQADLVGSDEKSDLALLRVKDSDRKFDYVKFAKELPAVGEWVLAVGNPFGLGGTVTAGIVSAHGRDINAKNYESFIQIDAAVNKGNSGGPTFNLKGEVIGINTAIYSPSGGNVGIAFAIPSNVASDVITDLKDNGKVKRGWLGVSIQDVSKDIADSLDLTEAYGAMVASINEGSPAQKAGVQSGDVILSVDGKRIKNSRELARAIGHADPDSDVELKIWRNEKEVTLKVHLGLYPDQANASDQEGAPAQPGKPASLEELGLTLSANADGSGLVIEGVEPDSAAAEKGLSSGDIIEAAAGKDVNNPAEMDAQIKEVKDAGRKTILLRIRTSAGVRFVGLPLKK